MALEEVQNREDYKNEGPEDSTDGEYEKGHWIDGNAGNSEKVQQANHKKFNYNVNREPLEYCYR